MASEDAEAQALRSPGRALALAAVALWSFVFVAFFGTHITAFNESVRIVAGVVYGLPVAAAAVILVYRNPHFLDLPVVCVLGMYALVAAMSSDTIASLETLLLASLYASVFLVALRIRSHDMRASVATGTCAAAAVWLVSMSVGWVGDVVEWISLDGGFPPLVARSGHLWLGTDLVPVLLMLATPFLLWIAYRPARNILALAMGASAVVIIPLSGARTAWIAIAVALGAFLLTSGRLRFSRRMAIGLGAVATVATIGVILTVSTGLLGTISGRTTIWATAVATIASDPLTGTGPGTFSWTRLAEAEPYANRYAVYHVHNLPLQIMVDGGILLLSANAAFVGLYLWHIRAIFGADARLRMAFGVLIGLALILMLAEPTQIPALTVMAITLAGWIAADLRPRAAPTPAHRLLRRALPVAIAVLLAVASPAAIDASAARLAAARGQVAAIAGDWRGARSGFEAAERSWPSHAHFQLALGLTAVELGDNDAARLHYQRASELSPGDPRAWGGLAALAEDGGERIRLLQTAAPLASNDPQYSYRLALALGDAGRWDEAATAMARAVTLDPQLLGVISGDDVPDLDDVIAQVATVQAGYNGRGSASDQDVDDHVALVLRKLGAGSDPAMRALARLREHDWTGAAGMSAEAIIAAPHLRRTWDVAAAVARWSCNFAALDRAQRLKSILPGGFAALYAINAPIGTYRDHVYRELGLGDYQPPSAPSLPVHPSDWPEGLLPEAQGC